MRLQLDRMRKFTPFQATWPNNHLVFIACSLYWTVSFYDHIVDTRCSVSSLCVGEALIEQLFSRLGTVINLFGLRTSLTKTKLVRLMQRDLQLLGK